MTDLIEVRGLRVAAICGVHDEERQRPQPIRVDLDIEFDGDEAAHTDAIASTVNYAELTEAAASTVASTQPRLLEKMADDIAHAVLAVDERVIAVTVTATKLDPPIPLDMDTVGVRRRVQR